MCPRTAKYILTKIYENKCLAFLKLTCDSLKESHFFFSFCLFVFCQQNFHGPDCKYNGALLKLYKYWNNIICQSAWNRTESCVKVCVCVCIKGVLHLLSQKKHVLCTISKIPTAFWKIIYESYGKLSSELRNSIKIYIGQAVPELLIQTSLLLFWSIT